MGFGKLLFNKAKNFGKNLQDEEEYFDHQTTDKYLRSLRRQRRTQMEEQEKIELKKEIKEYQQEQTRKNLYGVGENVPVAKQGLIKKLNKKKVENILKQKSMLKTPNISFGNGKVKIKKPKKSNFMNTKYRF